MVHVSCGFQARCIHLVHVELFWLSDDKAGVLVTVSLQAISENFVLFVEDDASPETLNREVDLSSSYSNNIANGAIDGSEAIDGGEHEREENDEITLWTVFLAFIPEKREKIRVSNTPTTRQRNQNEKQDACCGCAEVVARDVSRRLCAFMRLSTGH